MPIQIGIDNAIKGGTGTGTGGGGTPPVFEGLLDTYTGAAAGYSVRRLATTTTTLMRVRRSGLISGVQNDDEADVAYDSNNVLGLDSLLSNADAGVLSTTLGEFVGLGSNPDGLDSPADGYVVTWTDQSGNANDATQATVLNQPQVITAGAIEIENGKPAISFPGTATPSVQLPAPEFLGGALRDPKRYIVSVMSEGATAGTSIRQPYDFMYAPVNPLYDNIVSLTIRGPVGSRKIIAKDFHYSDSPADVSSSADMTQSQNLVGHSYDLTIGARIHNAYLNGVLMTGTATGYGSGSYNSISSEYSFVRNFLGTAQEIIYWNTDEAANRTGIETDINTFFSVYP